MDLRLTEKHWAYGEAGMLFPAEQMKYAHWADRPLFEPIEDAKLYTSIEVILNGREFNYLTFSKDELLPIIMLYLEPTNRRGLQKLVITSHMSSINNEQMFLCMGSLADLYPFKMHSVADRWTFELEEHHGHN